VVVTLHLVVEDLGLASGGRLDEVLVEELEDVDADVAELLLNLLAVLLDTGSVGRVALGLLLLFNRGDDAPRGTASTNDVLVGNREQVTLLNGELGVELSDGLHVVDHLCKTTLANQFLLIARINTIKAREAWG